MKITISPEKLQAALNEDGEFRLHSRYWDGVLQLKFGEKSYVLKLQAGEVLSIGTEPFIGPKPTEVTISAPEDDWAQLLQKHPRPFFEDFYGASMHHNFRLQGDHDYIWAYYAAIRRVGQILRVTAVVEEA